MLKYKKILVPYDGSNNAKAAIQEAVELAREGEDVSIIVASVCQIATVGGAFDLASSMGRDLVGGLRGKTEAALEEGLALVPEDIKKEAKTGIGSPGPILQEIGEKEGCDLIVMGSRGNGQVKGLFVGSVSNWLVAHAQCPVMVVK